MFPYRLVFDHAFPESAHQAAHARMKAKLPQAVQQVRDHAPPQARAIFHAAEQSSDTDQIEIIITHLKKIASRLIVIGTGGSGLSGKALMHARYGVNGLNTSCPLFFLDNLDPFTLEQLTHKELLQESAVLAISKSGGTVETLAQLMAFIQAYKQHGLEEDIGARFAVICEEGKNPMRQLAEQYGMRSFAHDPNLGGRFSIFSSVGMLPAAFMGMDIRAFRDGAAMAYQLFKTSKSPETLPFAEGAVWLSAMGECALPMQVFMPYGERFWGLAKWWRQSWAESLGKDGKGSTPVLSLGTVDQHSQLQLFLGGPNDKAFTLLLRETAGEGVRLAETGIDGLKSLTGHTLGSLLEAQGRATAEALVRKGAPLRVFELARLDDYTFGMLFMHLALEIMLSAELMGVNAFDQPAVEESKQIARDYLQAMRA